MRTYQTLLGAACAGALMIALAPAAMASDGSANGAVGFVQDSVPVQLTFNADVGPKGYARGTVDARSDEGHLDFRGKVDCFARNGATAYLSGSIIDGSDSPEETFLIGVKDSGDPGSGSKTPDRVRVEVYDAEAATCIGRGIPINVDVLIGNLQVRSD